MPNRLRGWLKSQWGATQGVNARLASRVKRWNAIYKAGGGTVAEYIHADFNTDCPEGLDTEPWAGDQFVKLESVFQSESYKGDSYLGKISSLKLDGWVEKGKDDMIHLNPLRYSLLSRGLRNSMRVLRGQAPNTVAEVIPHEFIHTRQHYAGHSGWARNNSDNDIESVGLQDLSMIRGVWRKAVRTYQDMSIPFIRKGEDVGGYYARNVEMQARMHEMLALGYAEWECLPTSKVELSAALINVGLEVPDSILDELMDTNDGQEALERFQVSDGIKAEVVCEVSTFNRVHEYAGEVDVQEAIWNTKYPLLYGELMEFYGDTLGRERMDMGVNPRPAIEAMYALKRHEGVLTQDDSARIAQQIPPSLAAPFLNNLVRKYPEGSDNLERAMRVSEALLEREDVRAVLFADEQVARNYIGHDEAPPLGAAVLHGHVSMVQALMKAGADPFQRYSVVDMRGKTLCSSCPVSCVDSIAYQEEALRDASSLPRDARKLFADPKWRESVSEDILKQKEVLQVMMDSSSNPSAQRKVYDFSGSYEETSLQQLMAKIGIEKTPVAERDAVVPFELG